jgi:osmotically-inducible protein OsmY
METSADTTVTNRTTSRTDEAIQRDVLAELEWDARLSPAEIGVSVKDGVVTLTGRVDEALGRRTSSAPRARGQGGGQ